MSPFRVERRSLDDPDVRRMIARLDAELLAESTPEVVNFFAVDHDEFAPGHGAFLVALVDDTAVACGAYRRIDESTAEIKRMWADPERRGIGLGAGILQALVDGATADGYRELRLETGEYLTAAVNLYRRFGFVPCDAWGDYVGVDSSYCMSRPLP
ncbi:MAG: GNAT family N-acetyltransferase [Ilumatobacteraceae bacterium]